MRKPRLAIIGSGIISHFHIEAFKKAGFDICHCSAKKNSQRAQNFSNQYNIDNYYSNPYELIEAEKDWDLILVAIDTEYNHHYLDKIISLNKLCLIEKPVSTDLSFLKKYLNEPYPKIRVAYNRRFYSTISEAKKFVMSNDIINCRMELPESINFKSKDKYKPVLLNSVHGIDLLIYLFGDLKISNIEKISSTGGRLCSLQNDRGDKISLIMNWNSPSNFSINLDSNFQRLEIKPFEICRLFEGMEILEPTNDLPLRRYIPKEINKISSFPITKNAIKPGFLEQAIEMKNIINGDNPKKSATLKDAYMTQKIIQKILYHSN